MAGTARLPTAAPADDPAAWRVLIMEDDALVCSVLTRQLGNLGIGNVRVANDGAQAAHALNHDGPFDLVISDLNIPGFDGIQLMRLVAARNAQGAILFSSSADTRVLGATEELARARGLHVLPSLPKPVSMDNLRGAIEKLGAGMSRRRAASEGPEVGAAQLQQAIDNEQIEAYVQPKLDARSGALYGVEALARWHHPKFGFIPPSYFVELADASGLSLALTELMLHKSLRACGEWRRKGLETRVAVNIPMSALQDLTLPEKIVALAQRCGVAHSQLILEITETGVMRDPVRALDVLTRVRLRDIELSIDDFGCGHATLQQLRSMPVCELKIDASFVMAALDSAQSRSIVKSTIELGRSLHLRTVAEGVETRAHWDLVRDLGCDLVQGYFIARPFPAGQLPAWMAQAGRAFEAMKESAESA